MSFSNGTFWIKCNNCEEQIDFQADEADFDCNGGTERQMGPEKGYSWNYEFKCFECNEQHINIEYEVYKYPVGAFNNDNIRLDGATELTRFDYVFQEEDEIE